ncbi:MAG: periplasmic heavy metal sensor [Gemmatimonadota bacterium]|nr:periplasmic heavy metal sensor [Gemmatimonadota bacterium]MDH5196997.1 periplasmic heavy metal sensor [Gemmatimonadota bacterium]
MTTRLPLMLLLGLLGSGPLLAQEPGRRGPAPQPQRPDPMEDVLFAPELVMQHQRAIGLTPEQQTAITDAVKTLQAQVVDFQWKMQYEQQQLVELLGQPTVQEATVLAQVDRVLEVERQIKRTHLAALIRIKNTLSAEQQQQLRDLRRPPPGVR